MAIKNLSAVELAKQRNEGSGGGNLNFFSLKEGEKSYLRFLTGMVDSYVISHSCGLNLYDYKKEAWDEAEAAGQSPTCPGCHQPIDRSCIQFERSECAPVDIHNYFPTGEADKKATFVCLASDMNASHDWVPANEDGSHMYECPACACSYNRNKDTGKPKQPALRLYGVAVEQDVEWGQEMVNGVMSPVIKSIKDVMVEENGSMHPKLVIVQMGWRNFWEKLSNFDTSYEQSICSYTWSVQRIGSGLQTTYDIQRVQGQPTVVDPRQYDEWMPDIKAVIQSQGNPAYYTKKGYQVPGYVPEGEPQQNAAGTAQAAIQNAAMGVPQQQPMAQPQAIPQQQPVQQPVQQAIPTAQPAQQGVPQAVPQPVETAQAGENDWSVVQNQFA